MDTPSNNANGFLAAIRTSHWWQYKAAPLMGFVYVFIRINHLGFNIALVGIIMSVITIIGIAGIGYVINDLYDIEFDKAARKPNRIGTFSTIQRVALIAILLLAASLPWLWLPFDQITLVLILFQLALYLLYSHPWIRFKEKHVFGIICDSLYGHVMPALIAIYTFHLLTPGYWDIAYSTTYYVFHLFPLFMVLTFAWLFFKGIRNIILHQIEDRKNDRITHLNTFVLWYGSLRSLQLLNRVIMPIELFLFSCWLVVLAMNIPIFAVVPCLFLLITYFKFSGWNLAYLPRRQSWFQFLYFLNDLYEDWLPLLAVILLGFSDVRMLVFLVVHLALFPGLVFRLINDLKLSFSNIKLGRKSEQERIIIK